MSYETPGSPMGFSEDDFQRIPTDHNESDKMLGSSFLIKEIRRGGMGEVYICYMEEGEEDEEDSIKFPSAALKTFQKRFFFNHDIRQAFVNEVQTWLKLSDQLFIMPALEILEYEHRIFVLMPVVGHDIFAPDSNEVSLRDILIKRRLEAEEILIYCIQLSLGMHLAQEKIADLVHGDLKPENLLMWGGMVHISDFGLARVFSTAEDLLPIESTWAYQAPECWSSPSIPLSDIYSFGAILFEMLFGRLPFVASTREGWKDAHLHEELNIPINFNTTQLGQELVDLAIECLRKNPSDRPLSFRHIFEELYNISSKYELKEKLDEIIHSYSTFRLLIAASMPNPIKQSVSDLMKLSNYEQALEKLEEIPIENYTAEFWHWRGNALSLLNRDVEALSCFKNALSMKFDARKRWLCLSDYALSLKRTGKYKNAVEIYENLIKNGPKEFEAHGVVNLATVYIEQGQPHDALTLLLPFIAKNPDIAIGWANIAIAYRDLGKYQEAVQCFQKAIALDPSLVQIQIIFVDFCIHYTQQIELADAILDNIYGQGHNSIEWFKRFQVCNKLLGRHDMYDDLMVMAKEQLSTSDFTELIDYIDQEIHTVKREVISKNQNYRAFDEPDEAYIEDTISANDTWSPEIPEVEFQYARYTYKELPLPYINTRIYIAEDMYSIDFYYPIESKDYINAFLHSLRHVSLEPDLMRLNLMMRETQLYFTKCPNCKIVILTNRDQGKNLKCRVCSTEHSTDILMNTDVFHLLSEINKTLGRRDLEMGGEIIHVFIAQSSEDQIAILNKICNKHRFTPLDLTNYAFMYFLMKGFRQGFFNSRAVENIITNTYSTSDVDNIQNLPLITGWQLTTRGKQDMYVDGMAPVVDRLLRELRTEINGLKSVAGYFDPHDASLQGRLIRGENEEIIGELKNLITHNPSDLKSLSLLVSLLLSSGQYIEAKEKAQVLTKLRSNEVQSWMYLGLASFKLEDFNMAITAYKNALDLNPLNGSVMLNLARSLQCIGDEEQAAKCFNRAQGLGGWFT